MKCIDSLNFTYPKTGQGLEKPISLFDELKDHVGVLSLKEARDISDYMEHFRDKEITWMSYPLDPLNESITVERNGGNDGKYKWSGLTHYFIEKYRADPPMEFREHVKQQILLGIDLEELAKELERPANAQDAIDQGRRRPYSPAVLRQKEWNKLKAEGGIEAAWLLYP